ncbi:MAG: alpha-L-fucosidase [Planctomycetota bacterium]
MSHQTDWMHEARWGTMTHYLADGFAAEDEPMTIARWNALVDGFDAGRFARTIAETGSGYHLFTVGQNSGYYCSPNETYDRLVGRTAEQSRLSRRDLIADVADALLARGVVPLVYSTSTAANSDRDAMQALACVPPWRPRMGWGEAWDQLTPGTDERLGDFQRHWEAIHREWSRRWGERVRGWWIDGCYYADKMYQHEDAPNFASFAAALKAGNPASIVAFNPGVNKLWRTNERQDYTAGEVNDLLVFAPAFRQGRFAAGAQLHILSFLGGFWGWNAPTRRFRDELVAAYTRYINDRGGAVTWDIPIGADGTIPDEFVRQLTALGTAIGTA